jgi:hypothetical protein
MELAGEDCPLEVKSNEELPPAKIVFGTLTGGTRRIGSQVGGQNLP